MGAAVFTAGVVAAGGVDPVHDGTTPAASPDQLQRWALALDSGNFQEREAACAALRREGERGLPYLQAAAQSTSREARVRAQGLLGEIHQQQFKAALLRFAVDKDGAAEVKLPGWNAFSRLCGGGADRPAMRRIFLLMSQTEPEILRTIEERPKDVGRVVQDRWEAIVDDERYELFRGETEFRTHLPSRAAFLLAYAVADCPLDTEMQIQVRSQFERILQAYRLAPKSDRGVLEGLLQGFVQRDSPEVFDQLRIDVGLQSGVKQTAEAARKILQDRVDSGMLNQGTMTTAYACLALARFGDEQDLPMLMRFFDVAALVYHDDEEDSADVRLPQVRDVALACCVHLTKQKMQNYGWLNAQLDATHVFDLSRLGLINDGQRAKVLEKFRQWEAARHSAAQPRDGGNTSARPSGR